MWRLNSLRHKACRRETRTEELKQRRREQEKALRQARREQQLVSRRLLQGEQEEEEAENEDATSLSKEQVMELIKHVQHGGEMKVSHLRVLRKALRSTDTQLVFIKLENSIQFLVGLLSGCNAACQMEAAHCLHELSHSLQPAVGVACLPATPYLLTYLSGQSARFMELCLYTLGNLCAESTAVRDKLLAQGIIPKLASCIQRPNLAVVEAVAFTLSQLLQAKDASEKVVPIVLASGLPLPLLSSLLPDPQYGMGAAIECAWCLHYLTASDVADKVLIEQRALSKCCSLLVTLGDAVASGDAQEGVELLVWPLLRCVGNLVAGNMVDSVSSQLGDSRLLMALCVLAQTFLQPHPGLAKESLWVLNNITADSSMFSSSLLSLKVLPSLIQLLPFSQGINVMVLRVMANIALLGPDFCSHLIAAGLLPALCATLRMAETEVVTLSLELLHTLLVKNSQAAEEFVKLNGLHILEAIQYNSQSEMRIRASYILDHHLSSHTHSTASA